MTRGGYGNRIKPAKTAQVDASAVKSTPKSTNWKPSISKPTFLSRTVSATKLVGTMPNQLLPVQEASPQRDVISDSQAITHDVLVESVQIPAVLECKEGDDTKSSIQPVVSVRPISSRTSSQSSEDEIANEAILDTFQDLTIEETQSEASSSYSKDSASIYSNDSASIYSSASSITCSGASMYSFDEADEYTTKGSETTIDSRLSARPQYQDRVRGVTPKRTEVQDAAARERSTLVKKAALFKNSRLPPKLPSFSTSLSTWSLACRAVQASNDCYTSETLTRRGTYIAANTSKDIKAMIVDNQRIDDTRLIIVAIRGTEFKSLTDWAVNKAANPVNPVGFLDDEDNACHEGFLLVAKAMVSQVATQLQKQLASEKPSLLFTGHSAGGATAAMLYSHMLSTSVNSELTALASQFSSVNCVTFGAPPLSIAPLPKRDHGSGVFLTFANEGDPVCRLSNSAYMKSLAKLMTASTPASIVSELATPKVKVVRRSRGSHTISRQVISTGPATPWEELPLWPTPPAPLTNAGEVILLRDKASGRAESSRVTSEELSDVIFGDLAQHTVGMYLRRVKDLSTAAMMGRL